MTDSDSIPTRQSLLARLKDVGDQESWREFFDTYWRLIHATALKAGLTDSEAQEVVQEVMIAAAKKMPEFTYDRGKDSLKGWLLAVTRWKVADQFRKREKVGQPSRLARSGETPDLPSDDTARTATVERVPDPRGAEIDAIWDGEWRSNLLRAALDRLGDSCDKEVLIMSMRDDSSEGRVMLTPDALAAFASAGVSVVLSFIAT